MLGKDSATVNKCSHSVQSSNNVKIYTQLMQKHTLPIENILRIPLKVNSSF